jgi:hypothetical protein
MRYRSNAADLLASAQTWVALDSVQKAGSN